jgi:hypothetical protein
MQPTCRYSDDRDAPAQGLTFDHRPRVAAATLAATKLKILKHRLYYTDYEEAIIFHYFTSA